MEQLLREDDSNKESLKRLLKLDDLNFVYFLMLYKKFNVPQSSNKPLAIYQYGVDKKKFQIAYPTAIASFEQLEMLPLKEYRQLSNEIDVSFAKKAKLWVKKMQAGTGSSMARKKYLARMFNTSSDQVKLGAKGTDLFIENSGGDRFSLAEIQILQMVADAKEKKFGGIVLHDIVSHETKESIERIWNSPCAKLVAQTEGLERYQETTQAYLPTIDDKGKVSFNRMAPGGHALFAVDALRAAYLPQLRPESNGLTLISSIGNGEDLGSSPDPVMVAWMVREQIPIAMITTTKTNIDLKGGQIALVENENHGYVTMIEKAQAESSNQLDLFELLGLRPGDGEAYFNTNMALFNYEVLGPKISALVAEIGEDKFLEIIAPDLIRNKKSQLDSDGIKRSYLQLEGAMGSVLLNLDRYWRERFKTPLVHFLNVDAENRTRFFSPIKTAFDFFMQFHSDRFSFDWNTYRLINNTPGRLPYVILKDAYYQEVENVLEAFADCQILELNSLFVDGVLNFKQQNLAGDLKMPF